MLSSNLTLVVWKDFIHFPHYVSRKQSGCDYVPYTSQTFFTAVKLYRIIIYGSQCCIFWLKKQQKKGNNIHHMFWMYNDVIHRFLSSHNNELINSLTILILMAQIWTDSPRLFTADPTPLIATSSPALFQLSSSSSVPLPALCLTLSPLVCASHVE